MPDNMREGLRGAGDRLRSVSASPRVTGMAKVAQGFKDFVSRGNAIELAVGVVVGAAFTQVVDALQNGFISPLIGWVFGKPNLEGLWDIGPYTWRDLDPGEQVDPIQVGVILNALLQFLITAAAIYFLVVVPLNALAARRKQGQEEEPAAPSEDVLLLQEIRDLLSQRLAPAATDGGTGTPPAGGTGAPPAGRTAPPPGAPGSPPPSIPPGS